MYYVIKPKSKVRLVAILMPLTVSLIVGIILYKFPSIATTVAPLILIPLVLIIIIYGVLLFTRARQLHLKITHDEISWIDILPYSNQRISTSEIAKVRYVEDKYADSRYSDKIFLDMMDGSSFELRTIHINPKIVYQKLGEYIEHEKFEING